MMHSSDETAPQQTPAMMTLGQPVDDVMMYTSTGSKSFEEPLNDDTNTIKSPWYSGLWKKKTSSPKSNNNNNVENNKESSPAPEYNALEDIRERERSIRRNHAGRVVDTTTDLLYTSLEEQDTKGATDVLARSDFFFRPTDGSPRKRPHQPWRALRHNNRRSDLFEYSDAVEVLDSNVLQKFRTQYSRLNQPLDYYYDENDTMGRFDPFETTARDLELTATETNEKAAPTLENFSSLVYEADGRKLMKLPCDQILLYMDPDLQPGVLSVEQWRPRSDDDCEEATIPLKYILTVNDDLYRKLVDEMAPTRMGCQCREDTKVDIRCAFGIFGFILFVLFIVSLAFREK